jgi:hypothetical protein
VGQAAHGVRLQVIIKRRSGAAIVREPPRLEEGSAWRAFLLFRYRIYANAIMSTWAIARSTPGPGRCGCRRGTRRDAAGMALIG